MITLSTLFRDPHLRRVFARAERQRPPVCLRTWPFSIRPAQGSDAQALKRPEA